MDALVWILGAAVVYWIYKSYQNNNPTRQMEKMEELAEKYFGEAVNSEKITISEYSERIKNKELIIHGDEVLKNSEKKLKQLQEFQEMYLRLKERIKHSSKNERQKLLQDWFDYGCALRDERLAFKMLDVDFSEKAWDNYDEMVKEPKIKIQEIEKRFKQQLKDK